MALDWKDPRHSDELIVQMVSQTNPGTVIGELGGIDRTESSLSAMYYSDTRVSGTLVFIGDGWVRGSFLRLIHRIPEWGWSRTLGTFAVSNDDAVREDGVWKTRLELRSMLHTLSEDYAEKPWTLAKGASPLAAMQQVLRAAKRPYVSSGALSGRITSALVMESGKSQLSRLFALSEASGNRIDVDGNGNVTIRKYVAPSQRTSTWELDLEDPRGLVVDGLTRSTDWMSIPSRVIVIHKDGEKEVSGHADSTGATSAASRGYRISQVRQLDEMSPATAQRAQQLARKYLAEESVELVEWEMETPYLPIWEGDIVDLIVHDGPQRYRGRRKCLVKSLDLDLGDMSMRLRLKETASGDKGEDELDD